LNYYISVLKKYAVFTGRARRKEYWFFILFNIIASFILGFIDAMTGTFSAEAGLGLLGGIYTLAVVIPSIAVSIRRLHDIGKSGWWFLLVLIPIIGPIALLVFFVFDSEPSENQYGPNPKLESL
jgi:uncharacterized membrane protein YhaH (DUF805 family)